VKHLAQRNRRSFMMTAFGAGSVPFASWASPLPAELSSAPASRSDGFHRLPQHTSALINTKFELTVEAGHPEDVQHSSANYPISSHQFTQDAAGDWRIYLDIRI
jgi:hypothetical protein